MGKRNLGFDANDNEDFVFISYNTENSDRVSKITKEMKKYNINLWYDYGLKSGNDFRESLSKHIKVCKFVLIFFSKEILKKENSFVYKEFDIAEFHKKKICVIVMDKINEEDVPDKYVDFYIELLRNESLFCYTDAEIPETVAKLMTDFNIPKRKDFENNIFTYEDLETIDPKESTNAIANEKYIDSILLNISSCYKVIEQHIGPSASKFIIKFQDLKEKEKVKLAISSDGLSDVRFLPTDDKCLLSLETNNEQRELVTLKEALTNRDDLHDTLKFPLGKGYDNKFEFIDLSNSPHLLISGTTNSGKTTFIYSVLATLMMNNDCNKLKFVLIDPKDSVFNNFRDTPHLLCPIITNPNYCFSVFTKLVEEMQKRYDLFAHIEVSSIDEFNNFCCNNIGIKPLPKIVVVIDELSQFNKFCKEAQKPLESLLTKARASGIYILIGTSDLSRRVLSSTSASNILTKITLKTITHDDSSYISYEPFACYLQGKGDAIVDSCLLSEENVRLQLCYVSDSDIVNLCEALRRKFQPNYSYEFLCLNVQEEKHQK